MKEEIVIPSHNLITEVVGSEDKFIKIISREFATKIFVKGNKLIVEGEDEKVKKIKKLIESIIKGVKAGYSLNPYDLMYAINQAKRGKEVDFTEIYSHAIRVSLKGKVVAPKTYGQLRYVKAIEKNDIIFAIGPAGTGKTYLAMAMAINYLINERVKKIILTRPVVEAGESLGFLPGNIEEKVNPYLRPLYDAMFDMMSYEKFNRLAQFGQIEIAPLAYMRGRTLNDAFIILDEAQNTNPDQMKMFLTRIGINSKAIITGDITQIDLPSHKKSGLIIIQDILKNIDGIEFVYLSSEDVVRHPLVQRIIEAYNEYEKRKRSKQS